MPLEIDTVADYQKLADVLQRRGTSLAMMTWPTSCSAIGSVSLKPRFLPGRGALFLDAWPLKVTAIIALPSSATDRAGWQTLVGPSH